MAELIRMAEARRKAEWSRTCEILAMLHNVNRAKGQPARNAKYFLDQILRPTKKPAEPPPLDDFSILETIFCEGKLPKSLIPNP